MEVDGHRLIATPLDQLTGNTTDMYSVYHLSIPLTIINHYLPDTLQAFPSRSVKNFLKHYFFYSKPVIQATRFQLSNDMELLPNTMTFSELFQQLLTENPLSIPYNFVILTDCLIFIRIPDLRHISYHLLGKHITLSNRAKDVRFAGEIWCDENHCFQFNNTSGTYRPLDTLIEQTTQLFNHLAPDLQFQGSSFRTSTHSTIRHQLNTKIKQKLTFNST